MTKLVYVPALARPPHWSEFYECDPAIQPAFVWRELVPKSPEPQPRGCADMILSLVANFAAAVMLMTMFAGSL